MKTDRPSTAPLLAQLSVKLPPVNVQDASKPAHRETRHTLVANETTDDD